MSLDSRGSRKQVKFAVRMFLFLISCALARFDTGVSNHIIVIEMIASDPIMIDEIVSKCIRKERKLILIGMTFEWKKNAHL